MASLPRLPDPKPGEPVKASHIKQLADAIRKCWVTVAIGGGLNAAYADNGIALSAEPTSGPRIMVVTTTIGAMSGDDTGEGQAVDAVYDPATKKLTAGTGAPIDVRNYHEKRFLATAIIGAFPEFGQWWAFDINRCGLYQ